MKNHLVALLAILLLFGACKKKKCSDGKKNNGEITVDCGGPCPPCGTCSDGIRNQDETGVDCGGICSLCATCSDGIQNQNETSIDCGGPCAPCAIIYPDTGFYGRNMLKRIPFDTLDVDSIYSLAGLLPAGVTLRLLMVDYLENTFRSWTFPEGSGNWQVTLGPTPPNQQRFFAMGPLMADMPVVTPSPSNAGRTFRIEYYVNDASAPEYIKQVCWR